MWEEKVGTKRKKKKTLRRPLIVWQYFFFPLSCFLLLLRSFFAEKEVEKIILNLKVSNVNEQNVGLALRHSKVCDLNLGQIWAGILMFSWRLEMTWLMIRQNGVFNTWISIIKELEFDRRVIDVFLYYGLGWKMYWTSILALQLLTFSDTECTKVWIPSEKLF